MSVAIVEDWSGFGFYVKVTDKVPLRELLNQQQQQRQKASGGRRIDVSQDVGQSLPAAKTTLRTNL